MNRFEGKTVLITGSTGGIGQSLARHFAAEGARLVLVDLDGSQLRQQVESLGADRALAVAADVSNEEQTQAALDQALQRWTRIDVAALNAGIEGRIALLEEQAAADFDRVMAVNVRGVFLWLSRLLGVMRRQQGGVITITSSTGGLRGNSRLGPYVASKHAVIGLMKSAALEGAPHGVRVNCVNPGPIETRMMEAIESGNGVQAEIRARNAAGIPLRRYGTPDEVAAMVAFLSSAEAAYTTGSTFVLDGGGLAGKA
ncbi:MAG: SDR family oxidoreductase [Ottowia sp.]|uniref:SDR family NAD(P)-dependent oxidoreductase n=1 Tax=Ottowia sp. TaxID=1898956 RepID=UPI003C796A2D